MIVLHTFTYNRYRHSTCYTKRRDSLYTHSILNILIFLVLWNVKVSLPEKPRIHDDANARKKATSMAILDIILHRTMGNNMIFDIISRVSFLFDFFLLFLFHLASQLCLHICNFFTFSFSILCFKHDEFVAKLLRRPQQGSYTNESTIAANFYVFFYPIARSTFAFLSCFHRWNNFWKKSLQEFQIYAIFDVIIPA